MRLTLPNVLLSLGSLAGLLVALTVINHVWPFSGTRAPHQNEMIGLGFDLSNFFFAMAAYAMVRARRLGAAFGLISAWCLATIGYGFWLVLCNPISMWTVGIAAGLLLFCAFMAHLCFAEARSSGLLQNGKSGNAA